ncbi:three-deoxy-D-manno-octulosonic-acid transferase domain protein [Candidatus Rickettsiella viridis]|uniref:3-deoxy-D-manno-octulosonic acid transferase n=1 Tax=Candidatus Rickettsiella viridis TaxID=676208 RepID=A0A2Z5UXB8_9COXI|nr:three-deoxy-D-manno-octulosonic-acid transferase domain protein [Candidatus Rickettsiella viridis]
MLPFILLRLWVKSRKNPVALKFWHERLSIGLRPVPQQGIWLHAVSVGESMAAIPLIKGLQQRYPNIPVIVTNETIGGVNCIHAGLGSRVTQLYFPYDLPCVLKRFFKTLKPRLLILMETELWPNLLVAAHQNQLPVVLANARLSARSARRYRLILPLMQAMLRGISKVIAATQADADRFVDLGLPRERVHVTGSIKFDLELPPQLNEQAQALREHWGNDRLVWIAASTHEGEEEQILEAFSQLRKKLANVLLVSVPRHIDRADRLKNFYQSHGYQVIKRSENKPCSATTDIFVGDTLGELLLFYAAADLAFIGGSLVKKGGQNPLEPAAVGLALLTGPYTFNFALITEQLKQRGVEIQINTAKELEEQVITLLSDLQKRKQMGSAAKNFIEENKGSLQKHLKLIENLIHEN